MGSTAERRISTSSCLLQKVLLLLLSYELPKHDGREATAGRQDKQSITLLHAINNQPGFSSSRFHFCADLKHYFFPTVLSLVKVLKEKTTGI